MPERRDAPEGATVSVGLVLALAGAVLLERHLTRRSPLRRVELPVLVAILRECFEHDLRLDRIDRDDRGTVAVHLEERRP